MKTDAEKVASIERFIASRLRVLAPERKYIQEIRLLWVIAGTSELDSGLINELGNFLVLYKKQSDDIIIERANRIKDDREHAAQLARSVAEGER